MRASAPTPGSIASTLCLIAIVMLAATLRYERLFDGLWLDELHTSWVIGGSFSEMGDRAAMANVSPVWFLLPRASVWLGGASEAALRAPSFAAGLGVIVALYLVVWRWSGSRLAGLLAAFLGAVDRHFIFYAADARAYATLQLLAMAQVACFLAVVFPRGSNESSTPSTGLVVATVGLSALVFYVHYTAVLLLIAEALFALRHPSRPLLIGAVATAVLCLAALPQLLELAARGGEFARASDRDVEAVFSQYVFDRTALVCAGLAGIAWALARTAFGSSGIRRLDAGRVWWCVVWYAVPVGLAWLLTTFDLAPLLEPRYTLASAAAPMVLAGLLCGAFIDVRARAALALGLAVLAYSSSDEPTRATEGWREAIARISDEPRGRDLPVLVRSGLLETRSLTSRDTDENSLLFQYALLPATAMYRIEPAGRTLSPLRAGDAAQLRPDQRALIVEHQGAWLLLRGTLRGARDVAERIREDLAAHGHPSGFSLGQGHGTVHLFRLELSRRP